MDDTFPKIIFRRSAQYNSPCHDDAAHLPEFAVHPMRFIRVVPTVQFTFFGGQLIFPPSYSSRSAFVKIQLYACQRRDAEKRYHMLQQKLR